MSKKSQRPSTLDEDATYVVLSTDMAVQIPALQFTIHDRLRLARQSAGLEQAELAAEIGINRQTVSHYETGATSRLKPLVLRQWALICEQPLGWLMTGDEWSPEPDPTQSRCISAPIAA